MDLHGIVSPYVGTVNPLVPVVVQVSIDYATGRGGVRSPAYATPGDFAGSIAGTVLTVSGATAGVLGPGQTLIGDGIDPATQIVGPVPPNEGSGGVGTYLVTRSQTRADGPFSTALQIPGQIQAMTARELAQIEGLNLNGEKRGVYFPGAIAGVQRWSKNGGDWLTFPDGSTWLTVLVIEQWPNWCKIACTRQNVPASGASPLPIPRST